MSCLEKSYSIALKKFSYGAETVFEQLSFSLQLNCWTGLLGKSGCGKSTLLRVMAGLMSSEGCHISLSPKITYMSQQDGLLPWATILENIILPQKFKAAPDLRRAHRLIDEMGLSGLQKSKPHELSMGMRQRVALARTLMADADLILLDEPFSALDCLTRFEMHKLTQKCLKEKTVFLVTHDPDEAHGLCDKTYLMKNGDLSLYSFQPDNRLEQLREALCIA